MMSRGVIRCAACLWHAICYIWFRRARPRGVRLGFYVGELGKDKQEL